MRTLRRRSGYLYNSLYRLVDEPWAPIEHLAAFGGLGDGSTDDHGALTEAIGRLPSYGGLVYCEGIDEANDFALASTLNIGNGTSSSKSTVNGIVLTGPAAPEPAGLLGGITPTGYGAARLKWAGGTGTSPLVSINGPIVGCGIRNLYLDAQKKATSPLMLIAAQHGEFRNLSLDGPYTAAINWTTVASFGGLITASLHNKWNNIWIRCQPVTGRDTRALLFTGEATNDTDTYMETLDNVTLVLNVAAGQNVYGVYHQRCDNITIRGLHFAIVSTAHTVGSVYPLVYDYAPAGAARSWPGDCAIDGVNFGDTTLYTAVAINNGTPSAYGKNRVIGIKSSDSGGTPPADPGLGGLAWGYTAANP